MTSKTATESPPVPSSPATTTTRLRRSSFSKFAPISKIAPYLTPLFLTAIFILLIESANANLHPLLPHAGKLWVVLMSTYTFRQQKLMVLSKFVVAGMVLRVLVGLVLCQTVVVTRGRVGGEGPGGLGAGNVTSMSVV